MQLLGRSEIVKDYIKHGETEAWVEITLSADDTGKPATFRRHMKSTSGSSEWKLDSEPRPPCTAGSPRRL